MWWITNESELLRTEKKNVVMMFTWLKVKSSTSLGTYLPNGKTLSSAFKKKAINSSNKRKFWPNKAIVMSHSTSYLISKIISLITKKE
jgi:hypothetical protein